jgi:hypothetical protein
MASLSSAHLPVLSFPFPFLPFLFLPSPQAFGTPEPNAIQPSLTRGFDCKALVFTETLELLSLAREGASLLTGAPASCVYCPTQGHPAEIALSCDEQVLSVCLKNNVLLFSVKAMEARVRSSISSPPLPNLGNK